MLCFEKLEKLSGDKNGKMCVFESIFIDFREMSEKTCGFYRKFRGPKLAVILGNVWSTSPSSSTTKQYRTETSKQRVARYPESRKSNTMKEPKRHPNSRKHSPMKAKETTMHTTTHKRRPAIDPRDPPTAPRHSTQSQKHPTPSKTQHRKARPKIGDTIQTMQTAHQRDDMIPS